VINFNEETHFMQVNYPNSLRLLVEDVNQLALLGFRLPEDINPIVDKATQFLKQATDLDQIASFHNTIGDRMIPSLRPMMLETAVALSQLVTSQNAVSWNSIQEVEDYISNFRAIVRTLSRQNNHLSQNHGDIKAKVPILLIQNKHSDLVTCWDAFPILD